MPAVHLLRLLQDTQDDVAFERLSFPFAHFTPQSSDLSHRALDNDILKRGLGDRSIDLEILEPLRKLSKENGATVLDRMQLC
jgi:hypothetical protein